MDGNSKMKVHKLSAAVPHAAMNKARERLHALRRLTSQGAELGEELSQVVERIRQVAAPADQPFLFTGQLAENQHLLQAALRDCDDVKYRTFETIGRKALLVYLDGMTDTVMLEKNVLETLMQAEEPQSAAGFELEKTLSTLFTTSSLTVVTNTAVALEAILIGHALILLDGVAKGIVIGSIKHVKRNVETARSEGSVRAPFDAFNETLQDNIVLIRRRSRDPQLKVRIIRVGERTKTALAVIYVANLVKPGLVEELFRRLEAIHTDRILLATNLSEAITDHPWTPFPQVIDTEMPERVVASLYEGRVAILTDNTPFCLIVPCTYTAIMQSTDDFSVQPVIGSLLRLTRHVAAFVAIYLPAIYIAIVSYHPGILPTPLAISIAELRAKTPFPSFLEAVMMEVLLELIQEAVVRLPNKLVGVASMLGAFVIGTTVVQAGLINPLLVVVTSVTAIASFSISSYNFGIALRALRIPMFIAASVLGLYGVIISALLVTIHLCSLRSFGESWLGGAGDITLLQDWKDGIVRLPARYLRSRPKEMGGQELSRAGDDSG
ncbi:spore germination protein|uniref:Spore germination protein n=1 Tax=Dendrosporobacter quercicolus TaxID=146817 RepID=A0A1G9UZA3_9FIRM|nr:spore germination protein [Dendrosporobacter quercicolus]NSL47984.1 spore germination protein [Dendrosporobacter quercicolus DSM 1736]SDM64975.1 spore germination protein [Dendrosporobacter quercicolus]